MIRTVLGESLLLALLGVVVGIALGWAASAALSSLLYGVATRDLPTLVAVSLLMLLAAAAASYAPARRALRVEPADALRHE